MRLVGPQDLELVYSQKSKYLAECSSYTGCTNVEADLLSRNCYSYHKWQLNRVIFQKLRAVFPALSIDLFASMLNAQLPRYVSWNPDPHYVC